MSSFSIEDIMKENLKGLDEDLLQYITLVVEEMSVDERKSQKALNEVISPFLIDSGLLDEDGSENCCKKIAVAFGGSGRNTALPVVDNEQPALLNKAVRIMDQAGLNLPKVATYGGVITSEDDNKVSVSNISMDISTLPTTQKQLRKIRRENEQLQRILRLEAAAEAQRRNELLDARMNAIKVARTAGRSQTSVGVNIDGFSLPHPSGTGHILEDASLLLVAGRRYGLIGLNGAGKSTLMRAIAGYKLEGLGHLRILLVDQHVEGDGDSPLQWLLRADVERTSLLEEEALLTSHLHATAGEPLPKSLEGVNLEVALSECYERMDLIGVASAENRAKKILEGLGFTEPMMTRPSDQLSGGWAMRAALGAAIFVNPHLLLLDEPTNHLDLHALVWLEHWLTDKFQGIALVVSHDSCFLDSVCSDILELRSTLAGQSKGQLTAYSGDYATYLVTLSDRKKTLQRAKAAQEMAKDKLKEFISRDGKKYDSPAHQAQRKMKIKQLEKMSEIEEVEEDAELTITLPEPNGVFADNEKLISVMSASFAYEGQEPLFGDVDFAVNSHARLAVLGKNGCGKTSLLNIVMGEALPTKGSVTRHPGCRVMMLEQHHYKGEQLDPFLSALEHIRRLPQDETTAVGILDPGSRQEESTIRSYLANFGMSGGRAMIPVRLLSGGQRMRVALAVALFRKPDVLILDEPTNHMDSTTVKALCDALDTYQGSIIAVSHDEAFINRVIAGNDRPPEDGESGRRPPIAGELWVMSRKKLQRFEGSFREYKKMIHKKVMMGVE